MARRQLRIVRDGERRADPAAAPAVDVAERADSLADNPGLRALLDRGLNAIVALAGASAGAIRLIPAGADRMRLVSAVGLPLQALVREEAVELDCGVCGAALRNDGARLDAHASVCERTFRDCGSECGPVLAIPLHSRGKPIGVFNLFFGDPSRMPADPTALLEPAARMLDLVLDNARLEHERLQNSLVAERQMLAGEVHDSLAQGLAYMRMRMPLLHDAIHSGERGHALKYYADVNDAMEEAHGRLRELITQFRHAVGQGLLQALESTARTFEHRTGVALRIDNRAPGLHLPPDREIQVYQIVQEALANVIKHAGARNARIVIERTANAIRVSVEDDGRGVLHRRSGADGEHYGLEIMRERAHRIGGHLEIRSTPGKGTRVRVVLPNSSAGAPA